jgi:hypothetical protein
MTTHTAKTKAAAPDQENAASKNIQQSDYKAIRSRSTSTESQMIRLLALLRIGPQTTYSLRKHGIAHPAGRIENLRAAGHLINTERVTAIDSDGYTHIGVAKYSLIKEAPKKQAPTKEAA